MLPLANEFVAELRNLQVPRVRAILFLKMTQLSDLKETLLLEMIHITILKAAARFFFVGCKEYGYLNVHYKMIRIHLRCHVGAAVSAPHPCAQHRKERAIKWLEGLGRRDLVVYFYLIRRPSDYVNACTRSPKEARIINLLFYLFLSISPPSTLGGRERTPAPLPAKATSSVAKGLLSWVLMPLTWLHVCHTFSV